MLFTVRPEWTSIAVRINNVASTYMCAFEVFGDERLPCLLEAVEHERERRSRIARVQQLRYEQEVMCSTMLRRHGCHCVNMSTDREASH